MKAALLVTTFCGVSLLFAAAAEAQKKPSGCGQDIPVTVQVLDDAAGDADYGEYLLQSDGGSYSHAGKLDARIQVTNCSKDFVVLLGQTTRRLLAYLDPSSDTPTYLSDFNFDRVGYVPVTFGNDEALDAYCAVVSNPASQTVDGNYGGCGVDSAGRRYVRRAVVLGGSAGSATRRLFMQAPQDGPTDQCSTANRCLASWVRVYHPDVNTWILSPEPLNAVGDGWDAAKPLAVHTQSSPKTGQEYLGVVELPFRIVVSRQ